MVDFWKLMIEVVKKTWKYGAAAFTGYEAHEVLSAQPQTQIITVPQQVTSLYVRHHYYVVGYSRRFIIRHNRLLCYQMRFDIFQSN